MMNFQLVADSSCDVTAELKKRLGVTIVPLTLTLGEKFYVDDEKLNLQKFMKDMKNCTQRIGSAASAPALFQDAFKKGVTSFAVTLSENLSGSYGSAMLGKSMAEENGADVHVFNSKSASAGEVLLALKIRSMIDLGLKKAEIIENMKIYIDEMKTYFVLESIDNLMKNGRLNKVVGKLISILNIKPVMKADGSGNIALHSHARGRGQIVEKLADTIEKSGKNTKGETMVITHCNNPSLSTQLMNVIKKRYFFKEILVVPTRGLSSLYADDKGIVIAF
ncbi:hypothetical protein AGMMS50284_3800 [Clostridia bacterium]|nr:hypothetical protein AGMMS50284_3800 [Clostridia bacterium]